MTDSSVEPPGRPEPPPIVYKYLTPDRVDVLESRCIRFTQASALNDPFELRPYFDTILGTDELEGMVAKAEPDWNYGAEELDKYLPPELKGKVTVRDLVQLLQRAGAYEEVMKQVRREILPQMREIESRATPMVRDMLIDKCRNHFGILSLTEDPVSSLMWSHYAASHTGFLIGFRTSDPWFSRQRGPNDEFFHLRQVEYVDGHWAVSRLEDLGPNMLVRKPGQWRYEGEWRMLAPIASADSTLTDKGEKIALFAFPELAIDSIVLGAMANPSLGERISAAIARWLPGTKPRIQMATLNPRDATVTIRDQG